MKILKVNPEKLEQAWPHASKWIAKANLRGNSNYPLSDMGLSIAQCKKSPLVVLFAPCHNTTRKRRIYPVALSPICRQSIETIRARMGTRIKIKVEFGL